ncbi:endolytic transglycosylase MltG [Microbacterium sp. YY-01]|uniref:endolytic transglycosylase MltG n=1 Tax=Microbacterium sp. YY-01 TaxID=3421634 RepID=UPI003D175664
MTDPSNQHPVDPSQPLSRRAAREAAAREQAQREAVSAPDARQHPEAEDSLAFLHDIPVSEPHEVAAMGEDAVPEAAQSDEQAPENEGEALDDLFDVSAENTARQTPVVKPRRRGGCLILVIILVLVLGGIGAGGVYVMNEYGDRIGEIFGWGEPKDWDESDAEGEAYVTIRSGDAGAEVSTALFDAGITKTDSVFYDMLLKEAPDEPFFPGVYRMQQKMTAAAALEALRDPESKLEDSAALPEGLTVDATLERVSIGLNIPKEELEAAVADPSAYGVDASSLEGWLFPAVYEFDPGTTAEEVITAMVDRTRDSLEAAAVPAGDEQRVLTIASIIQREARFEDDFYKVSRVIQNRLDDDMMLQMDSTSQYGYRELHDGSVSTSDAAQHDDNPWNTYVHTGLPVTPIANPGDLAIDAAMNPADGPWLYFVTVNLDTGETVFTTDYEEHLRGVEQWQAWCSDNPDSGC